jgi:hypothetical protein
MSNLKIIPIKGDDINPVVEVLLSLMVLLFVRESCPGEELVPLIADVFNRKNDKKINNNSDKSGKEKEVHVVSIDTLFELFPCLSNESVILGGSGPKGPVQAGKISGITGMNKYFDPFGDFLKFGGNNVSPPSDVSTPDAGLKEMNLTVSLISTMKVHTNILEIVSIFTKNKMISKMSSLMLGEFNLGTYTYVTPTFSVIINVFILF